MSEELKQKWIEQTLPKIVLLKENREKQKAEEKKKKKEEKAERKSKLIQRLRGKKNHENSKVISLPSSCCSQDDVGSSAELPEEMPGPPGTPKLLNSQQAGPSTREKRANIKVPVAIPQNAKVTRRQRAILKTANAQRKQKDREKLRANPEKYEEAKAKERERYHKRKEAGKIKFIGDVKSERKKAAKRKKWREAQERCRKRKDMNVKCENFLIENSPPPSPVTPEQPEAEGPIVGNADILRKKAGRKKLRRTRSVEKRELDKLRTENELLKRKLSTERKRFERAIKRKCSPGKSPSPNKVAKTIMTQGKEAVRRQLLVGITIEKQLKTNAQNCKTNDEKRQFCKAVSGELLKKEGIMGEVESLKIASTYNQRQSICNGGHHDTNKRRLRRQKKFRKIESVRRSVVEFYLNDSNSITAPGARDCITRRKVKKQKRYMLGSVKELHKKFSRQHKIRVSYATFWRLKPFWVVTYKAHERETCLCIEHENFKLKLDKLHHLKVIKTKDRHEVLQSVNCNIANKNCMFSNCEDCKEKFINADLILEFDNEETFYYKWQTEKRNIQGKNGIVRTSKRTVKKILRISKKALLETLNDSLPGFCEHIFKKNWQRESYTQRKDKMKPNVEACVLVDWSQNYDCKYYSEVQSAHFGNAKGQISLQTGMFYIKTENLNLEKAQTIEEKIPFSSVSGDKCHKAGAVWASLRPALYRFKNMYPAMETIHFHSDGPSSQYRNQYSFYLFAKTCSELGLKSASWNFSETGHGKDAADGVGGVLKRTANDKVAKGSDVITVNDFMEAVSELKVTLYEISSEDIANVGNELPKCGKGIPKTMQTHQIIWNSSEDNKIFLRSLSCNLCSHDCEHFGLLKWDFESQRIEKNLKVSESAGSMKAGAGLKAAERVRTDEDSLKFENYEGLDSPENLQITDWVVVIFDDQCYPGVVEFVDKDTVDVNFMVKSKIYFQWPWKKDKQTLTKEGILCKLKSQPDTVNRRLYRIPCWDNVVLYATKNNYI